jgi:uncharacterized protein
LRGAKRRSNPDRWLKPGLLRFARNDDVVQILPQEAELTMSTPPSERPADTVDPKLLEILVCPLTKCPLEYDAEKQELISRAAKLAYPIRDGIPIMLPEEARRIE